MNYIRILLFFVLLTTGNAAFARMAAGPWRGVLQLNDSTELPFLFDVSYKDDNMRIVVHNGPENLEVRAIRQTDDSVSWKMPFFESRFYCALNSSKEISGVWLNPNTEGIKRTLFRAKHGVKTRFEIPESRFTSTNYAGNWQIVIEAGKLDSLPARGLFEQNGNLLKGTIMSVRGDYRYLEGYAWGNHFKLCGFDGGHAFVFAGDIINTDSLHAGFWFGVHNFMKWNGKKNPAYRLPDPKTITFVDDTTAEVHFSLYNSQGRAVSLADEQFRNKVVIIQLMGSWCPICYDETNMLKKLYNTYHNQGLEIVALDYEKNMNPVRARETAERFRKECDVPYDILVAGRNSYALAHASFPQLNKVTAFPTTIYLDKSGKIREVYTGFSGPATGAENEALVKEIDALVKKLLAE
jgi:thiol-disulfide isomerase/thioredoxin